MDTWLPRFQHPCPRKLHHPGEKCGCAKRLDVTVPHGYSRAGDRGDVHASRLQNVRWRLGACPRAREKELPVSLRALAKDHLGDAVRITLRPLSPPRAPVPASQRQITPHTFARQASGSRPRPSFRFSADLVAEIPHLTSQVPCNSVPEDRSSLLLWDMSRKNEDQTRSKEDHARLHLQRLQQNNKQVLENCDIFRCFSFLFAPHAPRHGGGCSMVTAATRAKKAERNSSLQVVAPLSAGGQFELFQKEIRQRDTSPTEARQREASPTAAAAA